jgi:predicted NBD/HSP70 family sugar kinase
VPIKEHLSARLQRPIFVENNVRAAALAEYHFGGLEVQGSHCLLLVKVGSGIGMGIVLDGKLYRGPRMAAGEFGQMIIADCAGPERHDHPGCVEMLAADPATCDRYRRLAGVRSRGNLGDSTEQVKRICQLAVSGDEAARQAVLGTARYLGVAIANAVWALDADAVVIDGALTEAWTLAAPAIREQFPDSRRFPNFRNLMLRPSSLRGEAVILGAISLPFTPLFSGA